MSTDHATASAVKALESTVDSIAGSLKSLAAVATADFPPVKKEIVDNLRGMREETNASLVALVGYLESIDAHLGTIADALDVIASNSD